MTLKELMEWMRHERGIEIRATVSVQGAILRRGRRIYAVPGLAEDDVPPLRVVEAICETLDLPYLDLGLDPRADD
jgi:hypothetical protein